MPTLEDVLTELCRVVPIALFRTGDRLADDLRRYKDDPSPAVRGECAAALAALLSRFLERHADCLGGPFTLVTTVPSTRDGPAPLVHPLVGVVSRVPALAPRYRPALRPDLTAWGLVRDHSVLLVDDTFVTGVHVRRAASALLAAGAREVVALVIGRQVSDEPTETFCSDRCRLCNPA
ncbi:hypothetical protein ACIBHX_44645 [Nonomuraea sp. NPDC050536]|uniref:hypothetical protein n=1 Tax=Nonomuraea sp. NPDC050536 TaxID=3364366 RepID=UPI0037CA2EBF